MSFGRKAAYQQVRNCHFKEPTFTGQCLRWNSLGPIRRNINHVWAPMHGALMFCSEDKLNMELENTRKTLLDNSEHVISITSERRLTQFSSKTSTKTIAQTIKYDYIHLSRIGFCGQ